MKKGLLLIACTSLLLSGCGEVTFGYNRDDTHSAGLDHETSYDAGASKPVYQYYEGDSLNNEGLNKANLTFIGITDSRTDIRDLTMINSYVSIDQEIFVGAEEAYYFSTKSEGFAFLGADSSYVDGKLVLAFNTNIKNVEIVARSYSYLKTAFNENSVLIDHEVALSVNDSKYIKLKDDLDEDHQMAVTTNCSYSLSAPSDHIVIKAARRRAIIEKIILYY